jgi:hypothetical protein
MAQKRNRAVQKPGSLVSRNRAKLNSQTAQKAPIQPAPRTGPRRQLPPSTQGGSRVGNSSQPWGPGVGDGSNVRKVTVKDVTGPAKLPGAKTAPTSKQLPGSQNVQPQARPAQPGTSRPPAPTRAQAATAKAAQAAKGGTSSGIRVAQPQKGTSLGRIGANTFKGQAAEAAIYTAAKPVADAAGRYLGTKLGEGLRPVGRRIDDLLPGVNSKDEARRIKARTPLRTMTAAENAKAVRLPQATGNETKPKPVSTAKAAPSSSSSNRSYGGSSMSSPVRTSSPKPAAPQVKQSKDMNENYKAWAAANPALAAKVKQGQSGYEAIKGGTPSSSDTASAPKKDSLKISADTAKNFRTDIALLDKKKKK